MSPITTQNNWSLRKEIFDYLVGQIENGKLKPGSLINVRQLTEELNVSQSALTDIVRFYTREAGVRSMEREIAKICRKVVKDAVLKPARNKVTSVTSRNLEKYLGVKRFRYGVAEENDQVGQVNGLAWTEVGGELLTIEAAVMPGKGKLSHTGQLGDVMQESIQAAMTTSTIFWLNSGSSPVCPCRGCSLLS